MKHSLQIVGFAKNDAFEKLKTINANSPVAVRGTVQQKKKKASESEGEPQDSWELALEDIHLLNDFPKDIIMTPETVFSPEQRYLQLRSDAELREALFFKLLQLAVRQARKVMNTRFFNIFSTFEDIGTGKDREK